MLVVAWSFVLNTVVWLAQVSERQQGRQVMVNTKGASVGGHGALKGQHAFSWRDAMDIPVRWRQLSEPNDQVSCQSPMTSLACFNHHATGLRCPMDVPIKAPPPA